MHISILNVLKSPEIKKAASLCWTGSPDFIVFFIEFLSMPRTTSPLGNTIPIWQGQSGFLKALCPRLCQKAPTEGSHACHRNGQKRGSGVQTHGLKHHHKRLPWTWVGQESGWDNTLGQRIPQNLRKARWSFQWERKCIGWVTESNKSSKKKQEACGKVSTTGSGQTVWPKQTAVTLYLATNEP